MPLRDAPALFAHNASQPLGGGVDAREGEFDRDPGQRAQMRHVGWSEALGQFHPRVLLAIEGTRNPRLGHAQFLERPPQDRARIHHLDLAVSTLPLAEAELLGLHHELGLLARFHQHGTRGVEDGPPWRRDFDVDHMLAFGFLAPAAVLHDLQLCRPRHHRRREEYERDVHDRRAPATDREGPWLRRRWQLRHGTGKVSATTRAAPESVAMKRVCISAGRIMPSRRCASGTTRRRLVATRVPGARGVRVSSRIRLMARWVATPCERRQTTEVATARKTARPIAPRARPLSGPRVLRAVVRRVPVAISAPASRPAAARSGHASWRPLLPPWR